jgi:hypothetical protein
MTKTGWVTFWAIFSQTHPVTLSEDSTHKEIDPRFSEL